jgi:hypothetical protein
MNEWVRLFLEWDVWCLMFATSFFRCSYRNMGRRWLIKTLSLLLKPFFYFLFIFRLYFIIGIYLLFIYLFEFWLLRTRGYFIAIASPSSTKRKNHFNVFFFFTRVLLTSNYLFRKI